ncbi:MAG TPA: hypothetical protein VG938_09265 [Verrucomicrobiae bacterium]|jgi:hypothetical protein|nr:hypothetical protein [Verrucomicrobiae bacterium]
MKIFTLYIGMNEPGAGENILRILGESFPSFTFIEGKGVFRGTLESMWFVKIATTDSRLAIRVAENIRSTLQQDSVGIEYDNRYYKCTAADPASDLAKRLEAENVS